MSDSLSLFTNVTLGDKVNNFFAKVFSFWNQDSKSHPLYRVVLIFKEGKFMENVQHRRGTEAAWLTVTLVAPNEPRLPGCMSLCSVPSHIDSALVWVTWFGQWFTSKW